MCEALIGADASDVKTGGGQDVTPLPDFKVYCFHGEPRAIFVMRDRGSVLKTEFFDADWKRLENSKKYTSPKRETPRPQSLEKLLDYARRLSKPFPFVRCDFYIVNERPYFGELTFTPAGGLSPAQTRIDGKDMSDYLNVG